MREQRLPLHYRCGVGRSRVDLVVGIILWVVLVGIIGFCLLEYFLHLHDSRFWDL
jgi:hypothetical protein